MLGANVLVVEDETLIALDLADCVEAAGGIVVGPVPTVAEALTLLDAVPIDAAILDASVADRDVTPVATLLLARNVPTIIYSGRGLPDELAARRAAIPLIMKPQPPAHVVERLAELFGEHLRSRAAATSLTDAGRAGDSERRGIIFQVMQVLVGDGFREGRSAFKDGKLIGILVPVTAEEAGISDGGWYLEAGFGPCSSIVTPTPGVFDELSSAAAWFSDSLGSSAGPVCVALPH